MRRNTIRTSVLLLSILLVPLVVLVAEETSSLLIDGPQGKAKVIQVQGKNFVEVDEFAGITGSTLRFAGNQIILTLPGSGDKSAQAEQSAQQPAAGFSKPFLTSGIETMREILEWHAALKNGIERGYPLSDTWFGNYRRQVRSSLAQTQAAANTDQDQKALPLLTNEFNAMNSLTDKYLNITVSRDYLAPDSLNSDPLHQKFLTCWQSLASMASSNQFVERRFMPVGNHAFKEPECVLACPEQAPVEPTDFVVLVRRIVVAKLSVQELITNTEQQRKEISLTECRQHAPSARLPDAKKIADVCLCSSSKGT